MYKSIGWVVGFNGDELQRQSRPDRYQTRGYNFTKTPKVYKTRKIAEQYGEPKEVFVYLEGPDT